MENKPTRLTGLFDTDADADAAAAELKAAGYGGAIVDHRPAGAAVRPRGMGFVGLLFGGLALGTVVFGAATALISFLTGGDSNQPLINSVLGGAFVGAATGMAGGGLIGGVLGLHAAADGDEREDQSTVSVDRDDAAARGILTRHGARFN